MCAANVSRSVSYWTEELRNANIELGRVDTKALQKYVEKIVVFTQSNPVPDLGVECSSLFAEYAGLLASQGKLEEAATYLKGVSLEENILIDRLFNANTNKSAGSRPPPFPFEKVSVEKAKPKVAAVVVSTVQPTTVNTGSSRSNQGQGSRSTAGGAALPSLPRVR
jgi:hypothetical protein